MDPLAFERLMADYYRGKGYTVDHAGTGGRARRYDGGIDLKLYKDGDYTVVQCKRENAYQITHNVVHELLGVMLTEGASRAIVITTGEFTDAAWNKVATERPLLLIDGTRVREMLGSLLPLDAVPPPETPSLAASYWELSAPYRAKREREGAGQVWMPVGGRPARRRRKQGDASGGVVVVAVVLAMLMWQCSRKDPAPSRISLHPTQGQPDVTRRPATVTSPRLPPTATAPVPSMPTGSAHVSRQGHGVIAPAAGQAHRVAPPPGPRVSDEEAVKAYLERTSEM